MKTKKLLTNNLRYVLLAGVAALGLITILATGGGGGVTTTTTGGTTYNSGGSIGDLLTYAINTSNLTYSYNFVESDFGLAGTTGSGTLTQNADHTYTPSSDPNARVILLPNTLLVGTADVGLANPMLFTGVPALTTAYTPAEIAGIYNYITFACDDPLVGGVCTAGYSSDYGTFKVDAGGTWESADEADLGATPPATATSSGTWTDLGNGRISVVSGGNEIAKMMLLPSASGGKVMIGDLKNVATVQGPGIIVGVKREDLTGLDLSGDFFFNENEGAYGDVSVTNGTNPAPNYTGTHYDSGGVNPQALNGTLTRNDPWTGWLTTSNNTLVLILPGDGVWFATDQAPNNDWIQAGGAIP